MPEYEQKRLDLTTLISEEAPLIMDFAEGQPHELENLLDALMESKALAFLEGRHYQMVRVSPPFDHSTPSKNPYDKYTKITQGRITHVSLTADASAIGTITLGTTDG